MLWICYKCAATVLLHAVAHIELHLEAFSQLMVTIQESQTRSVVSIEPQEWTISFFRVLQ